MQNNANQVVVRTPISMLVNESLSDNIQEGSLRDTMSVTRDSSSTLEEEGEGE
jgi:small-conductance mechanosensitive channel